MRRLIRLGTILNLVSLILLATSLAVGILVWLSEDITQPILTAASGALLYLAFLIIAKELEKDRTILVKKFGTFLAGPVAMTIMFLGFSSLGLMIAAVVIGLASLI